MATFTQQCALLFDGVFTSLGTFLAVPDNRQALEGKTKEEIASRLKEVIGIEAGPRIAPALTGGAMPIGLTAIQPPPGVGAHKPRAAPKKADSVWMTLDEYRHAHEEKKVICAYMPNRGADNVKNHVCGSPNVQNADTENDPLKWRCKACLGKGGIIEKQTFEAKAAPPTPVVGFTTPAIVPALPVVKPIGIPRIPTLPKAPPPLPLPVAAAAAELPEFKALQHPNLEGYAFPLSEKYRNLVIKEEKDGNLICVGRLNGTAVTKEAPLPAKPLDRANLVEATAEDKAYLKENAIAYKYSPQD